MGRVDVNWATGAYPSLMGSMELSGDTGITTAPVGSTPQWNRVEQVITRPPVNWATGAYPSRLRPKVTAIAAVASAVAVFLSKKHDIRG